MNSKKNIKIFVSHRIDQNNEIIDNPLYVPVRCGAVFDKRENVSILGDNTGENISEKRMSFCELTVQYWAWKNIDADYYGLCHYRRYLSFSPIKYEISHNENNNGCVNHEYFGDKFIRKFDLNENSMRAIIEKYDVIACEPIVVEKSNYQCMVDSPDYHNIKDMDIAIKLIKEKYPEMGTVVDEYMNSNSVRLYNCFIMKKNIFMEYSSWLFDILFSLEKEIDMSNYSIQKYRTPGTIGERLFGIYCLYLQKQKNIKFRNSQLIFIENTARISELLPYWGKNQITYVSNFNNNYVKVFSCSLISILNHIDVNKKYEFIILSKDITQENKLILTRMCEGFCNVVIQFFDPYPYFDDSKIVIKDSVYSKDLFVRPLVPYILYNYSKCVIIDADTIVQDDIAKLYDINLENKSIGAVRDTVLAGWINMDFNNTKTYVDEVLKLSNPYDYCNTGVLIIDCEKFRNKYTLEYMCSIIENQNFKVYEQDLLNVLFDGDIKFLPQEWNFFTCTNDIITNSIKSSPINDYLNYYEARKNPKIVHFANVPKPWNDPKSDFANEFWLSARKTPYYEELLFQMTQNHTVQFDKKNEVCDIRKEFSDIHFKNINNHFKIIEDRIHFIEKGFLQIVRRKISHFIKRLYK